MPSDVAAQNKGEINRAHVAMGASSLRTAPLDQATVADARPASRWNDSQGRQRFEVVPRPLSAIYSRIELLPPVNIRRHPRSRVLQVSNV